MFPFFYALKKKLQKSLVVKKYFRYLYQITITKQTIMKILNRINKNIETLEAVTSIKSYNMAIPVFQATNELLKAIMSEIEDDLNFVEDNGYVDLLSTEEITALRKKADRLFYLSSYK